MGTLKRLLIAFLLTGVLLACLALPAQAQDAGGRDPVFEQEILERLAAANPQAVPVFQQATEAMDRGDYAAARAGFEQALALAPDFPDALRRLSSSELALEQYSEALEHAQRAYDLAPTAYNALVLADVLVSGGVVREDSKALSLAKQAVQELPQDLYANHVLMFAAAYASDNESLRISSETLLRLMPEHPYAHYFYGLLEAEAGHWERAEAELQKAEELGIPPEQIDQVLRESGIATQALFFRLLRWSGYALAGWLGGMLLLFLLGWLLSQLTLAAVRKAQSSLKVEPGAGERLVRAIYRGVITLASLYFYISIPFVILVILAATAGITYLFFAVGHIPVRLVIMIGLAALYTLYAVVRSLFTRIKEEEPGRPLTEGEAPALWRLTHAVADKLSTPAIQAIYVTPGTEIAVLERGSAWQKLRGKGRRSLILGLGVLPGLTQGQLKSILAHEYGHFRGKDTAGGGLARQVQLSMQSMAIGLAMTGQAAWYNPAWLFLNGFYRLFLRVTHGASRLQEILADRYAALAFGSRSLIEGLKHVVRQALTFDFQVNTEVNQSVQQGSRLNNLFTLPQPQEGEAEGKLAEAVQQALERPSSAYDTHPSPAERFRLLEQLAAPERAFGFDDERPAMELLPNAAQLQQEMTERVQANVDAQVKQMGAGTQA